MNSKWSVVRQIVVGTTIASMVLGVLIYMAVKSTRSLAEASNLVSHNHQVLRSLDGILDRVQGAEVGFRSYLLTGEESELEPLLQAQSTLEVEQSKLRERVASNPAQAQREQVLRAAITRKMEQLRSSLEQRRAQGAESSRALLVSAQGRELMAAVRAAAADLRQEEERLLGQNEQQLQDSNRATDYVFNIGGILGLLIFAAIGGTVGRGMVVRIGGAVTQVQSSSTALQTAASQQATGAREQASATTEISTTVKELLSTSRQIANSAQQVARVADDTAGAARTGNDTVHRAQETIDTVSRQVDAIVNHMLELGKRSQEIGGILDIINELAEQTNILAINATIESAGAGEHGKRFAVVAEEIRKLADRVGSATKDIRALIDEIRAASNTTIMATEDGSKAVQSSARQFAEVAGSFRRIAELVRTNLDVAREIEMSTQQQTTAVEQVNTAILEVAQTARQSEASSTQTLQTATQLIALSKELRAIINSRGEA